MISGFNHSESQKKADRVGERETNNLFFLSWPVQQMLSSSQKAQHSGEPVSSVSQSSTSAVPLNADRWLIAPL